MGCLVVSQEKGLTFVVSCSRPYHNQSGCSEVLGLGPKDQTCHHEVWVHLSHVHARLVCDNLHELAQNLVTVTSCPPRCSLIRKRVRQREHFLFSKEFCLVDPESTIGFVYDRLYHSVPFSFPHLSCAHDMFRQRALPSPHPPKKNDPWIHDWKRQYPDA